MTPEMSNQAGTLEIDKCISSRLWYTSLNVFRISGDGDRSKEFNRNCCIDLTELATLVESLM